MGKIFLEGKDIPSSAGDVSVEESFFQHLYLVYRDDSGGEKVIRGGPTEGDGYKVPIGLSTIEMQIDIPTELSKDRRGATTSDARGQIELDLQERNAEDVWNIMIQQAKQIGDHDFSYKVLGQNSNSVVASVMNSVDLVISQTPNNAIYPASGNRSTCNPTLFSRAEAAASAAG